MEDSESIQKHWQRFLNDTIKLKEIFGKNNIIDFIECELSFPNQIDSSRIFEEGKIRITFFPSFDGKEYFNFKLRGRLYNTISFEQNEIVENEHGRFISPYPKEEQKRLEEKFIQIIKNRKGKIHPWILKYYQNYKK